VADLVQPIFLICLGILPSLVWLWLFLHEEAHPEPKTLLSETFVLAILIAPLAVFAQWIFSAFFTAHVPGFVAQNSAAFFFWAAFVEEAVKYIVVYYLIIHRPEFDAPVDAMIYMVTAGLGFAAIENILVMFRNIPEGLPVALQVLALRSVGATLLHALCSGLVGYFLALSWFHYKHSRKLVWTGLGFATLFHFAFNFILLNFAAEQGIITSMILLAAALFLILILFAKLKDRSPSKLSTRFTNTS
jgi:RsiW-degrading membrane proteinase PrsW (M82 family)